MYFTQFHRLHHNYITSLTWIGNLLSGFHFDPFVGTEELGHLEMIGSIVHQLTRNLKDNQMKDPAFAPYFVDHTAGVYPASAAGTPWSAATMQVKGDPMADLVEDMAAEGACYLRANWGMSNIGEPKNLLCRNTFSWGNLLQLRGTYIH